jgi:hypothetical protein
MNYYILATMPTTGELFYAHKGVYLTRSGAETDANLMGTYGSSFTFSIHSAEELFTDFLGKGIRIRD